MSRSALMIGLLILASSSMAARADFNISIQSETVTSLSSPVLVAVSITSTGGDSDLSLFGYQLTITPGSAGHSNGTDPGELQFATSNQPTFGSLPSNYVFNTVSGYDDINPTTPVGSVPPGSQSNTVFNGGDFQSNFGDVVVPPASNTTAPPLLTEVLLTPGVYAPASGDTFTISLTPVSDGTSDPNYGLGSSTYFTDSSLDPIGYTSTSGVITFNLPSVPLPASFLMMGSGLGLTAARSLRRRIGR